MADNTKIRSKRDASSKKHVVTSGQYKAGKTQHGEERRGEEEIRRIKKKKKKTSSWRPTNLFYHMFNVVGNQAGINQMGVCLQPVIQVVFFLQRVRACRQTAPSPLFFPTLLLLSSSRRRLRHSCGHACQWEFCITS